MFSALRLTAKAYYTSKTVTPSVAVLGGNERYGRPGSARRKRERMG